MKPEGDKRVVVRENDVGLFSYGVDQFFAPASEDEGHWPDGFWSPVSEGGYYDTADDAERGARGEVDWLRNSN
jgi:hypothetical protein